MIGFSNRKYSAGFWLSALGAAALTPTLLQAQDSYEIQVYGSETVEPGRTMVELHSNSISRRTGNSISAWDSASAVRPTMSLWSWSWGTVF